jgi:hypothetical protein
VIYRPEHDVTIAEAFRAWLLEQELLPRLLGPEEIPQDLKEAIRRRLDRG